MDLLWRQGLGAQVGGQDGGWGKSLFGSVAVWRHFCHCCPAYCHYAKLPRTQVLASKKTRFSAKRGEAWLVDLGVDGQRGPARPAATKFPLAPESRRGAERAERRKFCQKCAQFSRIAVHAFSGTSLGKRGFATGWLPTTFIRFDQHVGFSFWIAMQLLSLRFASEGPGVRGTRTRFGPFINH